MEVNDTTVETAPGLTLTYREAGAGPPLLLVMGIRLQLVHWPERLCAALAAAGFRVIRYDNRDSGLSSHLDHLGRPRLRSLVPRGLLGLPVEAPYALDDMALDAVALLDRLGIARAHIVGVSMGGMIAQLIALNHPERVASLGLMMTSPGRPPRPAPQIMASFLQKDDIRTPEDAGEAFLARQRIFAGPGHPPITNADELRATGAEGWARCPTRPDSFIRQLAAIFAAPDRTPRLQQMRVPTRIIHGDIDPLVSPEAGFALSRSIPGSSLHIIQGMGHVFPAWAYDQLADLIASHAHAHPIA